MQKKITWIKILIIEDSYLLGTEPKWKQFNPNLVSDFDRGGCMNMLRIGGGRDRYIFLMEGMTIFRGGEWTIFCLSKQVIAN